MSVPFTMPIGKKELLRLVCFRQISKYKPSNNSNFIKQIT
jgi:hypothetical protein